LNKLFTAIGKAEGLVVSVRVIKDQITDAINNRGWSYEESYEEIQAFVNGLCEAIQGCTKGKVMAAIRANFKENEAIMPKKAKKAKNSLGPICTVLVDLFKASPQASLADCQAAIRPVVKADKNAIAYAKAYHKMLYAIANGLTSEEVLQMPAPAPVEAPTEG
jgi:hypothetical protein